MCKYCGNTHSRGREHCPAFVKKNANYTELTIILQKCVKKANGEALQGKCTAWMTRQAPQGRAVMRSHTYTPLSQLVEEDKLKERNDL